MSALFDLTGHVALVTGANSGIGLGMAHGLAEAGADVCVWGTNAERNKLAEKDLARHGTKVRAIRCDVSYEDAVSAAFDKTLDYFGRVDSCFANAGVRSPEIPFLDTTLSDFRRVTRVNLDGAFLTLRAAAQHMVARGDGGVLVGTSSVSAHHGTPRGQAYAASKAGLSAMMRSCAVELGRHKISAHSLAVGWTETPMLSRDLDNPTFQENVIKRIPKRRWGVPEDFARVAVYLAGGAGGFQTGDEIVIDGGYMVF
ncbi:SDR family NAD(P)-dependent oxidoreductase [Mycolicibacterium brumae]|uniref:2-deoxy-D-gluconate 3-dehydrogenase n=1 Tax=Mycolicibacterium brumae TaxID=85968 RepID=A0A2G5P4J9_9MYCO|nr:SDR family oxidoreductase [Mycolicibacterium brumae]MCV7191291.1 SDR family oxidoreductase [Mycolicibacterium brumae]PIB73207.1 2-deoxy-D-gluconate 3-dehydrogenase [Mycolicibacterium brumae]RWA17805.1 2-deoxy-D-gluconate 3-dehydrogenase [Mycolicibacterium brumae DSM 44177]UWW09744.1 SDR family oxidoreductase [Mycolicibacterium brumae]